MSLTTPDNLTLAEEARTTQDCSRQQELATHPSAVVRQGLARNTALCKAAEDIIGREEIQRLRETTQEKLKDTLKK